MSVVLDLGANIECGENNLIDFSELGSALYKSLYPNKQASSFTFKHRIRRNKRHRNFKKNIFKK